MILAFGLFFVEKIRDIFILLFLKFYYMTHLVNGLFITSKWIVHISSNFIFYIYKSISWHHFYSAFIWISYPIHGFLLNSTFPHWFSSYYYPRAIVSRFVSINEILNIIRQILFRPKKLYRKEKSINSYHK